MPFDLATDLRLLARTPGVLDAWLRGLPEEWVRATEGPGTWSAFDIVGHLIDGEETDWLPRTRHILSGSPEPFELLRREGEGAR